MRRRVPVTVTPEVGAVDIVRESGGGIVVAGDPKPLGAAICRVTTDLGLARSTGEAGRRHATAHYSWQHIAAQMEALYESLMSNMQINSHAQ
jgi:glycosyltransferase involved in cell wall biosynthesis